MHIDWRALIFEPASQERLQRQAAHRFKNETLAEEAITYAIETLSRDNWEILNAFDGRASPTTYLHVAFGNAFEDFHRRRFGRRRPPAWIQRLGSLWEQAFNMACLERLPPEIIAGKLCANAATDGGTVLTPEYARDIVAQIRSRVTDCETRSGELPYAPDDPVFLEHVSDHASPSDLLAEQELATLMEALTDLLGAGNTPVALDLTRQMHERRARLQAALKLADEDRLLLRLIYQDGCSVSEAARRLGQPDHTIRRKLRALLDRLRLALESVGLGAADILGMLRERAD